MDSEEGRYRWRWSLGLLLRGLSTERSCSPREFAERWLVDQLASWLVDTEFEPGKLRLRSYYDRDNYGTRYSGSGICNDDAFLMASFSRQHQCIREVRVHDRTNLKRLAFVPSVIVGPAPSLERAVPAPSLSLTPVFSKPSAHRSVSVTSTSRTLTSTTPSHPRWPKCSE
ncbi:hypothetical protein V5799_003864 [Amblyomma americanum]|uniref:Uncharacterized protein n=1 Tax=Amblyomma americanum TaxID=6943 RepID=A0AAQ4D7R6_AMBAM